MCGKQFNEKEAVFCPLCGEKITVVTEDKIKTVKLNKEKDGALHNITQQTTESISDEKDKEKLS